MPSYVFRLMSPGAGWESDSIEFASVDEARREALWALGESLRDLSGTLRAGDEVTLVLLDERAVQVFDASLRIGGSATAADVAAVGAVFPPPRVAVQLQAQDSGTEQIQS